MAGLYLHVPYCRQACSYCDFFFSTDQRTRPRFVQAVLSELRLRLSEWSATEFDTLYFGGGTPSLLSVEEITALMQGIRSLVTLTTDAEVTLEANPDDLDGDDGFTRLDTWRRLGINRLSLGVQSFAEGELRWMNRAHTAAQSSAAVSSARAAGFDNLNLDAIFHLPSMNLGDWADTLDAFLAMQPEHLSVYGLTIEPRTALGHAVARGSTTPAPDERFEEQFLLAHERLTAEGYLHYEVSNYAQPSRASRHNQGYWQGRPWLALGPSAEGSDGAVLRYRNLPMLHPYLDALEAGQLPPATRDTLSPSERANEFLLTSLRTHAGCSLANMSGLLGAGYTPWLAAATEQLMPLIQQGLAWQNDTHFGLTVQGWLTADGLTESLMLDTYAP